MSRRQPPKPSSTTYLNLQNRISNHHKPFTYQSSLEQFLRPNTSQITQKNQYTTPQNKRKAQAIDLDTSAHSANKRKTSLKSRPSSLDCQVLAGKDETTPIIIPDDSDDEVWDADTLVNSASTTRTLCTDIADTTSFECRSPEEPVHYDHTPATTPARSRSPVITKQTFTKRDCTLGFVPSSQNQERLSPLKVSSRDSDQSGAFGWQTRTAITDEIIPSSQSQHLLPYVISPQRARKFIKKPSPPRDLVPSSQDPAEVDLVLLARRYGSNVSKDALDYTHSIVEQVEDRNDVGFDKSPSYERHEPENKPEKPFGEQICLVHLDAALATPPTTIQTEDVSDRMEYGEISPTSSASSLPFLGGNDSQYTFVAKVCPSDIRDFLEELENRTVVSPEPRIEYKEESFQREGSGNGEPLNVHGIQLSSLSSDSQFSLGSSSQYMFVEASLPSDIAEFLDRLEQPLDSQAED